MFEHNLLITLFMLGTIISWGSSDFCGGFVTRRHNVYSVLLSAQLISLIPLGVFFFSLEFVMPNMTDLWFGSIAGLLSTVGLLFLYVGLAKGRMAIVSPITAMTMNIIPIFISILVDGVATSTQIVGFMIGFIAVWLLFHNGSRFIVTTVELRFAILSGIVMSGSCIAIDQGSGESVLWIIIAARLASIPILSLYIIHQHQWQRPTAKLLPLIILISLFDVAGNYFFTTTMLMGRLDVTTVASSLYPAITILLAWLFLKEQLKLQQWIGIVGVFTTIIMVTF